MTSKSGNIILPQVASQPWRDRLQDAQDALTCVCPWIQGESSLPLCPLLSLILPQGGDDTFGGFPEHLRALVSHALPNVSVSAICYPRFETRGDLKDCIARFREW